MGILPACMCVHHFFYAHRDQKSGLDLLDLVLHMIVSCHVGAKNRTKANPCI